MFIYKTKLVLHLSYLRHAAREGSVTKFIAELQRQTHKNLRDEWRADSEECKHTIFI